MKRYIIKNRKTKEQMKHVGSFRLKGIAEFVLAFLLSFGLRGKWKIEEIEI